MFLKFIFILSPNFGLAPLVETFFFMKLPHLLFSTLLLLAVGASLFTLYRRVFFIYKTSIQR